MAEAKAESKFTMARNAIIRELCAGGLAPGDKFFSENELTAKLALGKGTVREAVASLVADDILVRRHGSGTFVRNIPDRMNRRVTLVAGNPHDTGAADRSIGTVLSGLHMELDRHDRRIQLLCLRNLMHPEKEILSLAAGGGAPESFILYGFNFSAEITGALRAAGNVLVTIGKPEDPAVPYVHTNHAAGMNAVLRHLFEHGHRRVALVQGPVTHWPTYREQVEAYLEFYGNAGLAPDARLLLQIDGFDVASGERAADRLLARGTPFTAAVVCGDWRAVGFKHRLEGRGIAVPREVSLVCFGRVLPDITSLDLRTSDLAREAGRMLVDGDGDGRIVEPVLVSSASVSMARRESQARRISAEA